MALWGNNDNINSVGTVSVDLATLTVTGTGTSFGQVGSASTGDVIRVGNYGEAVITGITSARLLSIGSTTALQNDTISGEQFDITQSPKYVVFDSVYLGGTTQGASSLILTTAATAAAGVGTNIIRVDSVLGVVAGDIFSGGGISRSVSSIGATTVSLASTISSGISTGSVIEFSRTTGKRTSNVSNVSTAGSQASQGTVFETGVGWVGITTYMDYWGNMRVKKEILVAMSGIQTGNTPLYDSNPLV